MLLLSLVAIAALATTATSHGIVLSPIPRAPGPASLAACGPEVTNNIIADNTSHIEDLPEAAATDGAYNAAACNLWLCRGLQASDNTANVQTWTVGQEVPIDVFIRVRHVGSANVSIVDTKTNKFVNGGVDLISWPSGYADGSIVGPLPLNQTNFSVTIPDLGGACTVVGDCVLQWWWYGVTAEQTYESCIDFAIVYETENDPTWSKLWAWACSFGQLG